MNVLAAPARRSDLGRFDAAAAATAGERSSQRHRRLAVATVAGIGSRALTALSLLVALPLASARLDAESVGVWTLLVTALALLGFADLGLGNGLVNRLSDAVGRDDAAGAARVVSTAAVALAGIAVVGVAVSGVLLAVVPWEDLLRVGPGVELIPALAVFAGVVVLGIPSGLGQRIHLAYQQGWAASATSAAGSALALVATVGAWALDAGLPGFVAAMLVPPVLAGAVETGWVLGRSHRDLRPRRSAVERATLGPLTRAGGLFFVLAVSGAAAYQCDSVIISRYLGPEAVTSFGVSLRLFLLAPAALTAVLLPLWPAYGEAIGRGDHAWVRTTLRRSLLGSAVVSASASAVLLVVARPLLHAWAGDVAAPTTSLLLALAAWAVVSSVSVALAMWCNGAGIVRLQVIVALLMAGSNLVLSIALVDDLGAAGPVWSSVITQTTIVLVPELLLVRRVLRRRGSDRTIGDA